VKKIIASIFITLTLWAQNVKISGYVINPDENPVKDAVIEIKGESTHLKTISDIVGFFNFKVKPGIFKISAKHIAYEPFEKEIKVHTDTLLFISLEPRTFKFGEVTVTATRYETNSFDVPNFVEIAKSEDIEKVKTLSFSDILKKLNIGLYPRLWWNASPVENDITSWNWLGTQRFPFKRDANIKLSKWGR
jgi:hypothetical protein